MEASGNKDTGKGSEKNKSESACKDALIASEARYRRLFESAKDGILILEAESKLTENIINTVREPLIVLDNELKVIKANRSFYNFFKVNTNETIGKHIYDLGNRQWDIPKLRELLETILPEKTTFDDFEVEHNFSTIGKRVMLLNARQIERAFGKEKIILLAIEDITERKILEESLSEKNRMTSEYLDILLNYSHAPIIIWDSSLIIKRFNHEFEKLTGYNSTEVIDKKIVILFPENQIDSTLKLLNNHLNDGDLEVIEIDILTKNNDIKTVLWNSANIFDKEGTSTVATIAQDITRRKRTEEALRISEEKYRSIFENILDVYYVTSIDGTILEVSPSIEIVSKGGYHREDLIGKSMDDFYSDTGVRQTLLALLKERGSVSDYEVILKNRDGSSVPGSISAKIQFDAHRKPLKIVGSMRDITERKQTEEKLKNSEERFKILFDYAPDAYYLNDLKGTFIDGNIAAERLLGYEKNKLIGKSFLSLNLLPFNQVVKATKLLTKNLLGKATGPDEFVLTRKDGSKVIVEISTHPVKIKDKSIVLGIARDITERKLAENELIASKEKAEESDRLKSSFLANMSHEVRTPLNSIIGFSELLADSYFDEEQKNEFIQNIITSGNNLLSIINDIMDISKLESGGYKIRNSNINVPEFLSSVKEQFALQTEEKKLEFKLTTPAKNKETVIFADNDRLKQIFNNLMSNAIKFTPNGRIEIGYQLKGKMVKFFVKDTGIGIPVEFYEIIFERFRQIETSTTRNFGGNGLGLSISKNLIELMGGEIWIESELGKGSAFYFTIPYNHVPKEKNND